MTKLTQQEIEQERVKFEEWYSTHFGFLPKLDPNEKENSEFRTYENYITMAKFSAWLKRAELAKGE